MDDTNDLFCNAGGGTLFIRYKGIYYQRKVGQAWAVVDETTARAAGSYYPLHEKQREAYLPAMKKEGLINNETN